MTPPSSQDPSDTRCRTYGDLYAILPSGFPNREVTGKAQPSGSHTKLLDSAKVGQLRRISQKLDGHSVTAQMEECPWGLRRPWPTFVPLDAAHYRRLPFSERTIRHWVWWSLRRNIQRGNSGWESIAEQIGGTSAATEVGCRGDSRVTLRGLGEIQLELR